MRKAIPALTSLRFFAAAMIVIQHSAGYFHIWESFTQQYVLIQGVTFFFVLSGFILTYAHPNLSGMQDSLRFVWARVCRVWPAHAFVLIVFYVLWVPIFKTGYSPTTTQFLMNFSLAQAWSQYPSTFFSFNAVAWTLSVEMFFYVLFPVLILNLSRTWFRKLLFSAALAWLAIFIAISTNAPPFTGEDVRSSASWVYIWPPARLLEFVLGMVAGNAFVNQRYRLDRRAWSTVAGVAGIALILAGSVFMPVQGWKLEHAGVIGPAARGWITVSGSAPFYAAALFLLASGGGLVSSLLSWQPLVLLGEISFSIYLTHQVIIRALMIHPGWLEGWPMPVQMGLYWAATILFSWFVWRCVEKPSQRAMLNFQGKYAGR